MRTEIEPSGGGASLPALPAPDVLSPEAVTQQVALIQHVLRNVMKEGEHYGVIPGCGDKPTLLKPGAEKLSLTFRLAPRYTITRHDGEDGHREYEVLCELYHITTGHFFGSGVGLCSTMESKYRYRRAERVCPGCGEAAIVKGKAEYGGGWLCFKKKGGCGAKFRDGDPAIEDQPAGRVENEDLADTYNTVLKMAKKRAHIDAILTATAASDLFTQDLEDLAAEPPSSLPSALPLQPAPVQAAPEAPADYHRKEDQLRRWLASRRAADLPRALEEAQRRISSWPADAQERARTILEEVRARVAAPGAGPAPG